MNDDNELNKNGEGYYDPTAAWTLRQKESGDIWTYDSDTCLVLKNHGTFSTILILKEQEAPQNCVTIWDQYTPRYTDPRRLTYGHHSKMRRYIGAAEYDSVQAVVKAVEDALGISLAVQLTPREEVEPAEPEKQEITGVDMDKIATALVDKVRAEARLEQLQEMYDDLLARVFSDKKEAVE